MPNEGNIPRALAEELCDDWEDTGWPCTDAEVELAIERKCRETLRWDAWDVYHGYATCHEDPAEAAAGGVDGDPSLEDTLIDGTHLAYFILDGLVEATRGELASVREAMDDDGDRGEIPGCTVEDAMRIIRGAYSERRYDDGLAEEAAGVASAGWRGPGRYRVGWDACELVDQFDGFADIVVYVYSLADGPRELDGLHVIEDRTAHVATR